MRAVLIGLLALICAGLAGAARAEEWVPLFTESGDTVEVDVASLTFENDVAQVWLRITFRRPQRPKSEPAYTSSLMHDLEDCKGRRASVDAIINRNARGEIVASKEAESPSWNRVTPDSFGSKVHQAICTMAQGEKTDDVRDGAWKSFGVSDTQEAFVLMDDIGDLGDNVIGVISRSDYKTFQKLGDVPYRHLVQVLAMDCSRRRWAVLSVQAYLTPTLKVLSEGTRRSDLKFTPIVPGTFASPIFDSACKAQRVSWEDEDSEGRAAKGGGLSVGTAWATNKGYLVTSSHVVAGGKSIEVYQNEVKVGEAKVVANDPANDLALLKFIPASGAKLKIIPLSDKPAALGRSVFTLGFPAPDVMGQKIKMSAGEISSTAGIQDDARYMQISIPIQQGNSGGPVLGYDGSALGVVAAKLRQLSDNPEGPRPENVNYAVKAAYLRPLLDDLPDLQNYMAIKPPAGAPADELISQAREAVYMLVVKE